jgi:hypothetical protein
MINQLLTPPGQTAFTIEKSAGETPFMIEFFMVQGIGFRCMAYCDEDGKWRHAFDNAELFGDIRILE